MKRQVDEILGDLWKKDEEELKRKEEADKEWEEYLAPKKYEALFDFIKKLFNTSDEKTWESMTPYEKQRNAFMTNRFMAIKFPTSANNLNQVKCDGFGVIETWRYYVGKTTSGNKIPNWIYTKTTKKETDKTLSKFGKDVILYWCNLHECGPRELEEQYKYNPSVVEDLKYIESNLINVKKYKEED